MHKNLSYQFECIQGVGSVDKHLVELMDRYLLGLGDKHSVTW